ncbi:hypothetical protein M3Y96_00915400 [Aphelenchoides besseyi]|nr:hypothetical protein M3Y96_00915400 [Aphelenchoides besseyi]
MLAESPIRDFADVNSSRQFQRKNLDHRLQSLRTTYNAFSTLPQTSCRKNSQSSTIFHSHSRSSSFQTVLPKLSLTIISKSLLLLIMTLLQPCVAIRCYCTDDHCVPAYGVCESSVCLVGIRGPDQSVIRTCGEEPLGCQRNVDNWVDLCACNKPFCNTYGFLRESTQYADHASVPFPPHQIGHDGVPLGRRGDEFGGEGLRSATHQLLTDEDTRVFQRVDGPPGEYIDEHGIRRRAPITRSSRLTILIVAVPVSIGAAFILVVAFNVYCHLC